ncbi:hypothetical protein GCM10020219_088640 [Nonomuraea dietziae]
MDVTLMHLLEKPCTRCGHQCAVHTGGASPEGWAIYEPIWANAWGWCMTPDCECPQREGDLGEADEYKPRALGGRSPVGDIRRRVPPARRATPTPLHDHGATASTDAVAPWSWSGVGVALRAGGTRRLMSPTGDRPPRARGLYSSASPRSPSRCGHSQSGVMHQPHALAQMGS